MLNICHNTLHLLHKGEIFMWYNVLPSLFKQYQYMYKNDELKNTKWTFLPKSFFKIAILGFSWI